MMGSLSQVLAKQSSTYEPAIGLKLLSITAKSSARDVLQVSNYDSELVQ